jgi:hypothetical protein
MNWKLDRRAGLAGMLAFLLAGIFAPSFRPAGATGLEAGPGLTGSRPSTAAQTPFDVRVLARQQGASAGVRVSSEVLALPGRAHGGDPRIPGGVALITAACSSRSTELSGAHLGRAPPSRG